MIGSLSQKVSVLLSKNTIKSVHSHAGSWSSSAENSFSLEWLSILMFSCFPPHCIRKDHHRVSAIFLFQLLKEYRDFMGFVQFPLRSHYFEGIIKIIMNLNTNIIIERLWSKKKLFYTKNRITMLKKKVYGRNELHKYGRSVNTQLVFYDDYDQLMTHLKRLQCDYRYQLEGGEDLWWRFPTVD